MVNSAKRKLDALKERNAIAAFSCPEAAEVPRMFDLLPFCELDVLAPALALAIKGKMPDARSYLKLSLSFVLPTNDVGSIAHGRVRHPAMLIPVCPDSSP